MNKKHARKSILRKISALLVGAFCLVAGTAFGASGDNWTTATPLTASETEKKATATCVNQYSDDADMANRTGYAVYYYSIKLQPGTPLILRVAASDLEDEDGNQLIDDVVVELADGMVDYRFMEVEDPSGGRMWAMSGEIGDGWGCWDANDEGETTFYICVYGNGTYTDTWNSQGTKVTSWAWDSDMNGHGVPKANLYYQIKEYETPGPALGTYENPEGPLPAPTTATNNIPTKVEPEWGSGYYMTVWLEPGVNYAFFTTSGTANDPASVMVPDPYDNNGEVVATDIPAAEYNNGYLVSVSKAGTYIFNIGSTSGEAAGGYCIIPGRQPSQHAYTDLAFGAQAAFTPGLMKEPGSSYTDEVIDQCLFRFAVTNGHRYACWTDGAQCDLKMMVYDESGAVLAENSGLGDGDRNTFATVTATSDGYLYVGVCERFGNSYEGTPSGKPCSITVLDIEAIGYKGDDSDPDDDTVSGANEHEPEITASAFISPLAGDPIPIGPRWLGLGDWTDTFFMPVRAGFTCKVGIETNMPAAAGVRLKATVSRLAADGSETAVETSGSIIKANDATDCLSFTATADGLYVVRLTTATANGEDAPGLDWPEYTFHAVVYKSDAASYGTLTVVQKGLTETVANESATWSIAGAEGGYRYGMAVPVKGAVTVSFSAVEGFATPAAYATSVAAGADVEVMGVYNDTRDPGDDTPSGATAIVVTHETNTISGTLFAQVVSGAADTNDWFVFTASAGSYYHFRIDDTTLWGEYGSSPQDLSFTVYDADGNIVDLYYSDDGTMFFGAEADGDYYLCVEETDPSLCCGFQGSSVPADYSYSFSYWAVNVGAVSFAQPTVSVGAISQFAEVRLVRSSSEGATAVKWMTGGDDALAGVDYEAAQGIVFWEDGDSSAKTVRVPLLAPIEGVYKPEKSFYVRIVPLDGTEDIEYFAYTPAVPSPAAVKVVIAEYGEETGVGTVGFTAWGIDKAAFAGSGAYPSITTAPGEPVRLWVSRTDGKTGAVLAGIAVRRMTDRQKYYTGQQIAWANGDDSDRMAGIELYMGEDNCTDFVVSLEFFTDEGLAYPSLGVTRVAVHIDTTLPEHSSYPADPNGIYLAAGTFSGVLENFNSAFDKPSDRLAKVTFTGGNGALSAQVSISGASYTFTAAGYDPADPDSGGTYRKAKLTCNAVTIGDRTGSATLNVVVVNMMETSLETTVVEGAAILTVSLPATAGKDAAGVSLSGSLFRDNSDSDVISAAMQEVAGRYEFTLSDLFDLESVGSMTAEIDATGNMTLTGTLPDGGAIAMSAKAFLTGSVLDLNELALPFYSFSAGKAVGGTIHIGKNLAYAYDNSSYETWAAYNQMVFAGDSLSNSYFIVDGGTGDPYEGRYPHGEEDWFADVTLAFDGNGNSAGVAPEAISAQSGTFITLPEPASDFKKDGMTFLAWQDEEGGLYAAGAEFKLAICDQTLSAAWTYPTEGFAEALDYVSDETATMLFSTVGNTPWTVVENANATGGTAIKSGTVTMGQTSCFAVNVSGAQAFAFDWAVSCNSTYASVRFSVDGVEKARISGTGSTAFQTVEVELDGGAHVLTWEYVKTRSNVTGSDCAWVDNVRLGTKRRITLDPNGGTLEGTNVLWTIGAMALPEPEWAIYDFAGWYDEDGELVESTGDIEGLDAFLTAAWTDKKWHMSFDANGGTPTDIPDFAGVPGTTNVWPSGVALEGYRLVGWNDGTKTWGTNEVYLIGTEDVSFTAEWVFDFNSVVDYSGDEVILAASGAAEWTLDDTGRAPSAGASCLRSGALTAIGSTSELTLTVSGAGTLEFDWAVSCNATGAKVSCTTNGVDVTDPISGTDDVSWRPVTLTFEEDGEHVVAVTYKKVSRVNGGSNCAWLDNVRWTPAGVVVDVGDGKSVTVPGTWIAEHPALVEAAGGDVVAALTATAANGRMSVVECYVVGVDPESATDEFKITSFQLKADGTPDIENIVFDPPQANWNVQDARPVIKGTANLKGSEWTEVTEENKGAMRFFKVEVVLP